jgi:uncharacterized protein (DUF1330 family)
MLALYSARRVVVSTLAIAHLREVALGPSIVEYLQRIDQTLEPYAGRFIVHGGEVERLEGAWEGDLIVIEFPDRERARAWYQSAAYQAIVHLRTDNSKGDVMLIDAVAEDHRATDILAPAALPPRLPR